MRMTAEAVAQAPPEAVMDRLTDYDDLEARARARGVALTRTGERAWSVRHDLMGVARETAVRVAERGPSELGVETETAGVHSESVLRVEPIDGGRTRIAVLTTVGARGLGARMALGAMKPLQGEIERRIRTGLTAFAASLRAP